MAFLIGGANSAAAATGFDVANSCRFNDGDSAKMSKDLGSATLNTKFTVNVWLKLGVLGTNRAIFTSRVGTSGTYLNCILNDADQLNIYGPDKDSGNDFDYKTNRKFRDVGAWYCLTIAMDTTLGTAGDRLRIYVNGVEETSFATETHPAQNVIYVANYTGFTFVVGARTDDSEYWDGYMAEFVHIDGQQLAPTSFGEFDEDSPTIWKPIDVSELTFGNNGFYLDFEDSSNLGNDANGGTDLTEANLAAADQATDTPTNNFATFNPLSKDTGGPITYSEGNTIATETANSWTSGHSTSGMFGGKFYWECKLASFSGGSASYIGAASADFPPSKSNAGSIIGQDSLGIGYYASDGKVFKDGSDASYGDSYGAGDIIGMALDLVNNYAYWSKNGTWQNSGDPAAGSNGVALPSGMTSGLILFSISPNESVMQANFGGSSGFAISSANSDGNGYGNFEYAVPSGYLSLCTKNLGSDGG